MWNFMLFNTISFFKDTNFFLFDNISINGTINILFWYSLVLGTIYYYFNKFLQLFLKSSKVKFYKWKPTIRHIWNICFYGATLTFFSCYHKYFIESTLIKENGRGILRKYNNPLFIPTENCLLFNSITLLLTTFYGIAMILDLRDKDYSEASTKFLYGCILISLNSYGYENYSINLNLLLGLYQLFTNILILSSWHTPIQNLLLYKVFVLLRIYSWCYIYINILPFQYLIPTLHAKDFKIFLNVFLWLWYGSGVWNSPILQFFYHQIYHINSNDCIGENSISRCILLRDSQEIRHYKNLQKAILEIKLANDHRKYSIGRKENSSATAFQTLKCMMTLKRKLRRIRENKENAIKLSALYNKIE